MSKKKIVLKPITYKKIIPILGIAIFLILSGIILAFIGQLFKSATTGSTNSKDKAPKVYGYAYVYEDSSTYRILALNSNGHDFEVLNGESMITFYIKNNRLLIVNRRGNSLDTSYVTETYFLDLNQKNYQPSQISHGVMIDGDFDFDGETLFGRNANGKGIKKFTLSNQKEKVFEKDVSISGVFIAKHKVYYSGDGAYYSLSFDGKDKNEITADEYQAVVKDSGYLVEVPAGVYNIFYKNGKKVSISEDGSTLLYNDKEIYKVKDGERSIELRYSSNSNIISFVDSIPGVEGSEEYYYYYIHTKSLDEVKKDQSTEFREILLP